MRTTITKLQNDPSKQQEIDFLNEIAESIPSDSYLKDLFTEQLVNWVERRVKEDTMPNLYEWFQKTVNEVSDYEKVIRELNDQITKNEVVHQKQLEATKKMVTHFQELYNDAVDAGRQASQYYDKLHVEFDKAEEKIATLENEIIRLKAKLFDMMEAK